MVRVIVCRPGEMAAIEEIDDSLESMQRLVGGMIEEYQPFYDSQDPRVEDVAIFCNEEGKLNRLPPSRAILDEDGHVMDVIQGPFFLCYAPVESERFLSMPADLEEEFRKKYELPEKIYRTERGFDVISFDPKKDEKERGYER
jgi:hypothetical protein